MFKNLKLKAFTVIISQLLYSYDNDANVDFISSTLLQQQQPLPLARLHLAVEPSTTLLPNLALAAVLLFC